MRSGKTLLSILWLSLALSACATTSAPVLAPCLVDESLVQGLTLPESVFSKTATNADWETAFHEVGRTMLLDNAKKQELLKQLKLCR